MNILTPSGYVPAAQIKVGDEVCAFDMVTGAPITNTVLGVTLYGPGEFGEVVYDTVMVPSVEDPEVLVETQEPRAVVTPMLYYVVNGTFKLYENQSIWRNGTAVCHVKDLVVGDEIYDSADQPIIITSVEMEDGDAWWRFEISGDHSFIADGVTLHNASRFWVGGSGTWDASTTTHWSASTGGASGATAPTLVDDATFDSSSSTANAAYTVTPSSGVCANWTLGGPGGGNKVTLTGAGALTIYGSINMSGGTAGITNSWTGAMTMSSAIAGRTITSNGITWASAFTYSGLGGGWQHVDAFNVGNNALTHSAGTIDFNGQTVTSNNLNSSGSLVRGITMGAASVTLQGATPINFTGTNLTFSCGTSAFTLSATSFTIAGLGQTFYDVTATSITTAATLTLAGSSNASFHNLTLANTTGNTTNITVDSNFTVTGTLSITGFASKDRINFKSSVTNTQRTITAAALSLTDVNFQDIVGAGAAAPFTGTRIGDLLNNSGITFATPGTKYWVGGTGNWNDPTNHWATASGGAPGANNFPLPQDNIVFDGASNATAYTTTINLNTAVTDISFAAPGTSGTVTFAGSSALTVLGSLTLLSGMTRTFSGGITFTSRNTGKNITSNGVALGGAATFNGVGGGWTLQDAFSLGSAANITLTNGSLNANTKAIACLVFDGRATSFSLDISGSTLSILSNWLANSNLSLAVNTSTVINCGGNQFQGSGLTYNDVTISSSNLNPFSGANTFRNLSIGPSVSTQNLVTFSANQIVTGTFTASGNNSSNRPNLSSSVVGTPRTITAAAVVLTDVDFTDITGAGAAAPFTGTRIGDRGGNTSITTSTPKSVYWIGDASSWATAVNWAATSGGAGAATNYPLPQDTAVFDANSFTANTKTVTVAGSDVISGMDWSTITKTGLTLALSASGPPIYGNVVLAPGMTYGGSSGSFIFSKRGTQTFDANGATITATGAQIIGVSGASSTVFQLINNNVAFPAALALTAGTLDLNGKTLSATSFSSASNLARTLTDSAGGGGLTLTGNSATIWSAGATNLTVNSSFSAVNCTYSGSVGTRTITGALLNTGAVSFNISAGGDTISMSQIVKDVNFTGSTVTLGSGFTPSLTGSLTLVAGLTTTSIGTITFVGTSGTQTLTSAGKTLAGITMDGVGGTLSLGDNLFAGILTLTNGAFTSNTKTISATGISSASSTAGRTINLSGSTVTLTGASPMQLQTPAVGVTLTCNTSTAITCNNGSNANVSVAGQTFNDLTVASTTGTFNFEASSFRNLTRTSTVPASDTLNFAAFTVTGTITITGGTDSGKRIRWTPNVTGSTVTITAAAVALTDVNLQDITGAGAATWTGTRLGDLGGNSNITFATPGTKYWVAGTGSWSDATAHWATSSGGTPNANNFPLPQDNVVFDGASNATAYTVTQDAASTVAACTDLTFGAPGTSGTVTFAGTLTLTILGSITMLSGMTRTWTGIAQLFARSGSKTITSNGVTFAQQFSVGNGSTATWTLQDAFSTSGGFFFSGGTLDTNTKTFTVTGGFSSTGTTARTLNFSGSTLVFNTVSMTVSGATVTTNTATSMTVSGATFNSSATTSASWNDITFTANGTVTITGANTFRNLTHSPASPASCNLVLANDQTVTGTFTSTGTNGTGRVFLRSSVAGTARTITTAAVSLTDVDFQDITCAGAATWSGTRIGDVGGNTGLTAQSPANRYWVGDDGNWSDATNHWATSSGGAPGANNYPLPQDTAIFDASSFSANGKVVTGDITARVGNADWSGITKTAQTAGSAVNVYGNFTLSSKLSITGGSGILFLGRGVMNLTMNGCVFNTSWTVNGITGTLKLLDTAYSPALGATGLTSGIIDLNGNTLFVNALTSSGTSARTIKDSVGGGKISTMSTSSAYTFTDATNLTIDRTNAWTMEIGGATTTARTFAGPTTGTAAFPTLTFVNPTAAGTLTFTGTGSTFKSIAYSSGQAAPSAQTFQFTAGTTTKIEDSGASLPSGVSGARITLKSVTAGSQFTLQKLNGGAAVQADYCSITDSNATPVQVFYAPPATSTLVSNDTGWSISPTHPSTSALVPLTSAVVSGVSSRSGGGAPSHPTTGILAGQLATLFGSASHFRAHSSSGILTPTSGLIIGSAARTLQHSSSGILKGNYGAITAVAVYNKSHIATSTLKGQGSNVTGATSRLRAHGSAGDLTAKASGVAGATVHLRPHSTSGILVANKTTVTSIANRFRSHSSSGVVIGQAGLVAGLSDKAHGHINNGALSSASASLAGVARRFRTHAITGSIVGAGPLVASTSHHIVIHTTTGTLVGVKPSVQGASAKNRNHTAAGILTGPGPKITSMAIHNIPHNSAGVLIAQGAMLMGLAQRNSSYTPSLERTWLVNAENRTLVVNPEVRTWEIEP